MEAANPFRPNGVGYSGWNMSTFDQALGSTLRAVRESTGLTQSAAAEAMGSYQGTLSRWENGTLTPSAVDVACCATTYKTPAGDIYAGAAERAAPTAINDEITMRAQKIAHTIRKKGPHGNRNES